MIVIKTSRYVYLWFDIGVNSMVSVHIHLISNYKGLGISESRS